MGVRSPLLRIGNQPAQGQGLQGSLKAGFSPHVSWKPRTSEQPGSRDCSPVTGTWSLSFWMCADPGPGLGRLGWRLEPLQPASSKSTQMLKTPLPWTSDLFGRWGGSSVFQELALDCTWASTSRRCSDPLALKVLPVLLDLSNSPEIFAQGLSGPRAGGDGA